MKWLNFCLIFKDLHHFSNSFFFLQVEGIKGVLRLKLIWILFLFLLIINAHLLNKNRRFVFVFAVLLELVLLIIHKNIAIIIIVVFWVEIVRQTITIVMLMSIFFHNIAFLENAYIIFWLQINCPIIYIIIIFWVIVGLILFYYWIILQMLY